AEQARRSERDRIAAEMHDVLAHRVSLVALHAGALEIRPDQAPSQVQATAALIRVTARQALTELRDVIGVLRDREAEPDAPHAPLPTLADLESLVAEFKAAGLNVTLDMRVRQPESAPGGLGRDTYRIVREGLTNVTKHASGTVTTVEVSGRGGGGRARRAPPPPAARVPGKRAARHRGPARLWPRPHRTRRARRHGGR